jgi:predicted ATP-grasp superfamily ATP-dependent carboligase
MKPSACFRQPLLSLNGADRNDFIAAVTKMSQRHALKYILFIDVGDREVPLSTFRNLSRL